MALKITEKIAKELVVPSTQPKCGVIMPISSIGDYTDSHWADVLDIIGAAVSDAGLDASLVSNADEVTVIQKTIVQNLYENPIVICDVSGKNPNVMFELGLRLAFDKPTIVLKDDQTTFSFDTGTIEHLTYPRDLRFAKIVDFKVKLSAKIRSTLEAAAKNPEYSTFLKHFGKFTIAKLDEKEVTGQEFVLEELRSIRQALSSIVAPPPRVLRSQEQRSAGAKVGLDLSELDADARSQLREVVEVLSDAHFDSITEIDGRPFMIVNVQNSSLGPKLFEIQKSMIRKVKGREAKN